MREQIEQDLPVTQPGSAIKHSAAIQIENSITLLQRRTWNVLLANAYDELPTKEVHSIKVKDLVNTLGFESKNERYLKQALKALAGCTVEWNILGKDGTQQWGVTALLAQAEIESGMCSYAYSPALRNRLHNPNMYAKISLSIQKRFNSKHALALYELCLDYLFEARNYGETPFIPIATFRRLMGLDEDAYPSFKRLNQRVIKEPVDEINRLTDLNVQVAYKRRGRRVVAVKFRIWCTVEITEKARMQGELFPDTSRIPPLVADLIEAGLPKEEARNIYQQGFDYVNPAKRSHRTDFIEYVREKIDLLRQRQEGGKIKNPVGFLLEAIRENYTNFEFEARERARRRRVIAHDLGNLLKEREQVKQEYEAALEKECGRFLRNNPECAEEMLRVVLDENPFYRTYIDRSKTAFENYQSRPMLAGAINHELRAQYPKPFERLDREYRRHLEAVEEQIVVLEAEREKV